MGHVNPAACLSKKESWRWETTNSEYGKFYVRKADQKTEDNYSKKCEELASELLEAKAQLERLKIAPAPTTCTLASQDEACQTSPLMPRPPNRKLYKTEKMEKIGNRLLLRSAKDPVKRPRPCLKLGNVRNSQGNSDDQDIREDSSRRSIDSSSVKDHRPVSVDKRKIWQKQGGIPKKQKGSKVKETNNNVKYLAGGAANLPPSQRYTFYRNFGLAGQGAKTSRGWHSKTSPWQPI